MDDRFHFGIWLKRAIENLGISQKEFAKRAGVSFAGLRLWISHRAPNPLAFRIVRIARELGLSREVIEAKLAEAQAAAAGGDSVESEPTGAIAAA